MSDCLSTLIIFLIALQLALIDKNPFWFGLAALPFFFVWKGEGLHWHLTANFSLSTFLCHVQKSMHWEKTQSNTLSDMKI